jgi:hypothetical protein
VKLGLLLLIAGGLTLRQLNRWERQLLQGEGKPPRNKL